MRATVGAGARGARGAGAEKLRAVAESLRKPQAADRRVRAATRGPSAPR